MNRTQLQWLSEERVRDAEALLNAAQWSGAYYLAGYAVECALKACIAKQTKRHEFPDKERVLKSYSHKIEVLLDLAGLKVEWEAQAKLRIEFANSGQRVRDWDESSRYRRWTEERARALVAAVIDPTDGVLPWIMARW